MSTPPSTIAELRPVLIRFDAADPRSMQTSLGPSELGTPCQQQMARKLAGAPKRPITEPLWAPFQGQANHKQMESVLDFWNAEEGYRRWEIEDRLQIDDEISGSGDAYDNKYNAVVDWKFPSKWTINKVVTALRAGKPVPQQISQEYRVQGHVYGLGHERKGRPVKWVRVVFLTRESRFDDSIEWVEEYKPEVAYWALDRYYAVKDMLKELAIDEYPDQIAAVPAKPGEACHFCPFFRPNESTNWGGCAGKTAPVNN